ncbi:MAG: hypothetical protein AB9856_21105 [Cellulosilyticaceae bacterium]
MAKDVSIVFRATDNFSSSVRAMQANMKGLNVELSTYKALQTKIMGKPMQANMDITQARTSIKEFTSDIEKLNTQSEKVTSNTKTLFNNVMRDYSKLTESMEKVNKLQEDVQQNNADNSEGAAGQNPNEGKGIGAKIKTLIPMESLKKLNKAIEDSLNQEIISMWGQTKGKTIINVVGGAATGAATGFATGGVPGAAIGAVIGGLTGAINSLTEQQKKSDDIFKNEVRKIYDEVKKNSQKDLQDGISLASKEDAEKKESQKIPQDSYASAQKGLEDDWQEITKAKGAGYIEKRKDSIEKEQGMLDDGLKKQLEEANKIVGEHYAELENKRKEMILKEKDALMNDVNHKNHKAYVEAVENKDGATVERLMSQTDVDADTKFKNTKEYKESQESDQKLAQGIQDSVVQNGDYLEQGKKVEEQFELGWSGAIKSASDRGVFTVDVKTRLVEEHGSIWQKLSEGIKSGGNLNKESRNYNIYGQNLNPTTDKGKNAGESKPVGIATGLRRIPRNDYPALLHEGERVLTRVEADKQDRRIGGFNIAKLADSIVVREEADIDRIIEGLYSKFKKHAVNAGGVC